MNAVIIRTKLQSVIVQELLTQGVLKRPFHLIGLCFDGEPPIDRYLTNLAPLSSKVTYLRRPTNSFAKLFIEFFRAALSCKRYGDRLFMSNLDLYPMALALKMVPGLFITTFDDGYGNVRPDSPFLQTTPSRQPGIKGWIARALFPRGPYYFTRQRISIHYTIYPALANIVEANKVVVLRIRWSDYIDESDINALPAPVRRILLGTHYKGASASGHFSMSEDTLKRWIEWADLYIPHPRQIEAAQSPEFVRKYIAEALIEHYSQSGKISVAHFSSSACIPFKNYPNVQLIDLAGTDRDPPLSID